MILLKRAKIQAVDDIVKKKSMGPKPMPDPKPLPKSDPASPQPEVNQPAPKQKSS